MHWFWRAVAAAGAGCIVGTFMGEGWVNLLSGGCPVDDFVDSIMGRQLTDPLLKVVLGLIVAIAVFLVLSHRPGGPTDNETRCRKCGYILRGISEPRCPECGERI